MLKKLMLPIMIVSILVQLFVPVGMIAFGNNVENNLQEYGKEFRIKVYVQSVNDGLVEYRFYDYNLYRIGHYAVMEEDEEGYANLSTIQDAKPKNSDYIRITMENKAKFTDFPTSTNVSAFRVNEESAYIVIKVYNGNVEVVGLYMDGIIAEEWLENAVAETDEHGFVTLNPNV